MSFASNVRAELCRTAISRHCCAVAECYGVLLYCSACSASGIRIVTESRDFAARLPQLFRKAFSISFDDQPETLDQPGKMIYQFTDPAKISAIFEGFGLNAGESLSLHINLGALEEEHCQVSFLRGAFLAGGSVTNPEKRYHLELSTSHIVVNAECYALLLELGFISNATDLADYLVRKGMPFRSAYKISGQIVACCTEKGKVLEDLSLEEYKGFSELFGEDLFPEIDIRNCMEKRTSEGGASSASAVKQLKELEI